MEELRKKVKELKEIPEEVIYELKIPYWYKLIKVLDDYLIIAQGEKLDILSNSLVGYINKIISKIKDKSISDNDFDFIYTMISILEDYIENNKNIYISKIERKLSEIEYLHERINDLEKERTFLNKLSEHDKIEKENEISKYKELLEKSEQEKNDLIARAEEEKKRQDQIRNDWNTNIENAFKALNDGAKSINDEYKRVQDSFYLYKYGLVIDIILLGIYILFLIYFCLKNKPAEYIEFVPYHLPLLFFATLIWVCVSQMNKAQRQLIAFSDKIYRIKYLEGSLKGLNYVETNKGTLAQKTTEVLSRIIDKHLNESFKSMDEKTIIKEEKKDNNEDINVIRIMVNALNKAIEK
ncbi:MAG: hypothetical protein SOR57_04580 [Parabacteroides sp.]|nr:hypothetical protein [Parabacteroides sp.]